MLKLKLDIPEEFYREEVRCGYRVSTDTKKLWAVELDLLAELMRVMEEGNYKYYAWAGTLLGAARHEGFIPWDDDIDVIMPRDDFDRFCKEAAQMFAAPYFLQTESTDRGSLRGHAQLRNSAATMILAYEADKDCPFNQGAFIDIFSLDAIPVKKEESEAFFEKFASLKANYREYYEKNGISSENPEYLKYEKYISQYWNDRSLPINEISVLGDTRVIDGLDRALFDSPVKIPFEMLYINVPNGYKEILTQQYGDWNKYVIGGSYHGEVFIDLDNPYTLYTEKKDVQAAMRLYNWYRQHKLVGDLKWKDDYLEDCIKKIWKDEGDIWQEFSKLHEECRKLQEKNEELHNEINNINSLSIMRFWRKLISLKAKIMHR